MNNVFTCFFYVSLHYSKSNLEERLLINFERSWKYF